jgi:CMP-N,N'-diacetyllegionaminic acid synthase
MEDPKTNHVLKASREKPEVLAIIPARGGSKGIPRKNIALLKGKPLISYTVRAAIDAERVDRVVVSTDDEEIRSVAAQWGAEVPFLRPAELATDDASSVDVVQHCLDTLKNDFRYVPDVIVLLQPTSPLRNERHIDEAIELFTADPDCDACVSVMEVPHNFSPFSVMVKNGKYARPYLEWDQSRNSRQMKPTFLARNGAAIYITSESFFRMHRKLYGQHTVPYYMDRITSIDIDESLDLKIAALFFDILQTL